MKLRHPALVLFLLHAVYFYIHAQQPDYAKITGVKSLSDDVAAASSNLSPLKFEHLNETDGLSYNKVQCILQDKQGYIWFGTVSGLNRYDGYTFKVFENHPEDSSTITSDDIISLYQDKEGRIWVGTGTSSFSSYNPFTEKFKNYSFPSFKGWIHDFKEDENGLLWLATGYGLFSFDRKNALVYHKTDDSGRENIHGILKDKNNDIFWLSTETGIRKFDKKTNQVKNYNIAYPAFSDISKEITHNIIQDSYGDIWMSTSNSGVYRFNPKTEKLTPYRVLIANALPEKSITTTQIMEDTLGRIWIGGDRLVFFDYATQQISFYERGMEDPQGISGKIRALLKDNSGIYWVGTERGIAKYDPKLYSFITVPRHPPQTLERANTILEDKDHNFWVGNYRGLGLMEPNTGAYENHNEVLGTKEFIFSSLLDKQGAMWHGSEGCLFHIYKKNSGKEMKNFISEKIQLPGKKVNVVALDFDPNGVLWAGTKGEGIFRYDPLLRTVKQYRGEETGDLFSSNNILALKVISADSILLGTEGSGLILMHSKTGKFEKINFEKNGSTEIDYSIIHALCEDSRKNIWIGTENGGLWQANISLSTFKNYSIRDGLQSMDIYQIIEGKEGQIWLNTKRGLEIIDTANHRFVHFSEKDGLSLDEPGYLIKKASGDLMRIDLNGLHIFHSSSVNRNKDAPPVYINHLRVLDKEIPVYNDTTIHLKYNQNYISFEYVALNYTQSFKNRYKYKLAALDKNWIDAGQRRFASYANIPAGTYTFQVTACNNNGIWNDKPASLTLIIPLPWWNTSWFYMLLALIVVGAVYALFQLRLQQKMKAVELRNSISRDLHDEVGSTLSSISFLSSMALNDLDGSNPKIQRTLSSISESSRKMLDAMNDIIWSIQPQNDTISNIIARMIAFASELLEARKISPHYNIANNLKHLHLGVAVRHDFFVIFKEAVNNIAKYSEATEAHVDLDFVQPYIILTIKDNGKGFDPEIIQRGNGLKNMKKRAEKIGAKYQLHTMPGEGTKITLQVKPM